MSQHAVKWKVLGTLLDLPSRTLRNIEDDEGFNCRACCRTMLMKWLQFGNATWGKMITALESPTLSSSSNEDVSEQPRVVTLDDGKLQQFKQPDKANSRPLLEDLMQHFTPRYAANWKTIGTLLGLGAYLLEVIERDYCRRPNFGFNACNAMLQRWLETNPTASWTKLFEIVDSPALSSTSGKATSVLDESKVKGMSGPSGISDMDDGELQQFKDPDKVNSRPSIRDLHKYITPRYAADWKVVGTQLGIPRGQLDVIEVNHPNKVKDRCDQMLNRWLCMDTSASWGKLFNAIESAAVCSTSELPSASDQSRDEGILRPLRSSDKDDEGLEQFKDPDKVNTKPSMRDLSKYVITRYAADWEVI